MLRDYGHGIATLKSGQEVGEAEISRVISNGKEERTGTGSGWSTQAIPMTRNRTAGHTGNDGEGSSLFLRFSEALRLGMGLLSMYFSTQHSHLFFSVLRTISVIFFHGNWKENGKSHCSPTSLF